MATLPRPNVEVTNAKTRDSSAPEGSVDVVVSRDGKGRSYRSVGGNPTEVIKDVVEKIVNDKYTGEWLP